MSDYQRQTAGRRSSRLDYAENGRIDGNGTGESGSNLSINAHILSSITAVGQERITEDAFNKGANYYVMKPFNNEVLLDRIKSVRKMFRNNEKKNEDGRLEGTARGEDLENRVTNMLHEIGIPAHIKGYHYLRDAIIMAVNDMDVLNAITKILYPTVAKKYQTTSSRVETSDPSCHRGGMEPRKTGYSG